MKTLLRKIEALYSVEDAPRLGFRRWGFFAASAVLAAVCAAAVYRSLDLAMRYPEPIVGNPAWSFDNKFHDYAVGLAFVAAFILTLAGVVWLSKRIERRGGPDAEEGLHDLLCMASAPAGVWLAGLITTRSDSLAVLAISGALVAEVLLFATLLSLRSADLWRNDPSQFKRILGELILLLPAVWLAVAAVGVGSSRFLAVGGAAVVITNGDVEKATIVLAAVATIAAIALVLTSRSTEQVERPLRRALLLVQVTFPAFFLLLVPRPWMVDGRQMIGYPLSRLAWVFISACAAAAAWNLVRRCTALWRTSPESSVEAFSVMSVVGVLLFLKAQPIPLPSISPDDYHFGENLVPWWSLVRQHMIPFAEYSPARGLVNYLQGAAAAGFFDGTAASFTAVTPFVYVVLLLVAVPVLRRSMGLAWTALALFVAPYINALFEIDLVVTVFLALVGRGFAKWTPVRWLVIWIVCGTGLLLYAPGQAGLAIIATAPLAVFMAARGAVEDRRALGVALGALLIVAALAGTLTPIGAMVWGAVRYGLEQSAVNSVAHGIAWRSSFRTSDTNPLLFEVMRASWLVVAVWAGALILRLRSARLAETRRAVLPYAIPIFLLMTLFVFRAAGRIDPGPSRLAAASIWGLALLLPLLLVASSRPGARGGALFVWLFLAGIVLPHERAFAGNYAHAFEPMSVEEAALRARVDGASVGLPGLGVALAEPSHVAFLSAARALLDRILDPGETYADLSSRHAQYFYFDRRPPIETGAIYNLVAEAQQLRAIESLQRTMPPALLIAADNIVHDGGPIGLRSALTYRYVLLHPGYRVVETKGQVWLVRDDRAARLVGAEATISEVDGAATSPLNRVLRPADLRLVPASWGRSASSLEPKMRLVRELPQGWLPSASASVDIEGNGRYLVTGPDPFVRFDLSGWGLSGQDAGILSFDFHCQRIGSPPLVAVTWATDRNAESELTAVGFDGPDGHLIVPLDAAPAWLLANRIRSIRFGVVDEHSCLTFSVENVRFLQRHGADVASRPRG